MTYFALQFMQRSRNTNVHFILKKKHTSVSLKSSFKTHHFFGETDFRIIRNLKSPRCYFSLFEIACISSYNTLGIFTPDFGARGISQKIWIPEKILL